MRRASSRTDAVNPSGSRLESQRSDRIAGDTESLTGRERVHPSLPVPRGSGWLDAILRIPLVAKLAGANALVVVVALGAAAAVQGTGASRSPILYTVAAALIGSVLVNLGLVLLALRPLAELEATATRVWQGDLAARVPSSPLADAGLQRVSSALNVLLDQLTADRDRLRDLASRVIRAGDQERSYIARELHDSSAQSLSALLMELSVAERETQDPKVSSRLERIRRIAGDVLDEIRVLAQTVHPRVLEDLGLGAAMQQLARDAEHQWPSRVEVAVDESARAIGPEVSAVLYRVVQEALNNALRHANATTIVLRAGVSDRTARAEVIDNGVGFREGAAGARRIGMGLFTMRERVALLDGTLEIVSAPGEGTHVTAIVPLQATTGAVDSHEPAGT